MDNVSSDSASIRSKAYVCGVYCLEIDGTVIYVGRSKNVFYRLAQHMKTASFEFDSFYIIECEPDRLAALEAEVIQRLQPTENRMIPAHGDAPFRFQRSYVAGQ